MFYQVRAYNFLVRRAGRRSDFHFQMRENSEMTFRKSLLACAISAAVAAISVNAFACSTVIVGKSVSATGHIIVGHNEDNGGRIFNPQYYVPPAKHKAGEMITYEPTAAKIPQVPETLGFYWSQTLDPNGSSFSDGFVNDAGVVIVSNACTGIYDNDQKLKDGGIGYGIRRLMAERAHTAKEAIDIAIKLLGEYGYFSEGRTYTVADKNEAWQIAIHKGNTWVARRVQDNEIVYIPNNFMIGKVDATDTKNVIVAPGLVERSIQNGRYKPAKAGVYNDFNYRLAVQPPERRAAEYNRSRNELAWNYITGKKITDPEQFPYSVTPDRKFSVDDVKAILRLHEPTIGDDPGWYHHNGFGTCRPTSHESVVFELDPDPEFITAFRAYARPCETPYVPGYPLAKPAANANFMTWQEATAEQFNAQDKRFSYHAEFASTPFINHANVLEYQWGDQMPTRDMIKTLEDGWMGDRAAVHAQAKAAMKVSKQKALDILHNFNVQKMQEAQGAVDRNLASIAPHKIVVLAKELDPKSDANVKIALLSDTLLDATTIDKDKTFAGPSRASTVAAVVMSNLAKPKAFEKKDVNGDGKTDLVISFSQKDLTKYMMAGAVWDTYLYTYTSGKRICAFDTVPVKGQTNKKYSNAERGHDR